MWFVFIHAFVYASLYCSICRYIKCLKTTTFPEFHQSLATMMVCREPLAPYQNDSLSS